MTLWRERLAGRFRRRVGPRNMLPSLVVTASAPVKEVHHELNATRKRLNNIAMTLAGCNAVQTRWLQRSHETGRASRERRAVTRSAEGSKSRPRSHEDVQEDEERVGHDADASL